jgi:hypothetical protein
MAEITYPTTIKTEFEKLCAVYSLIEQMRLEHNRQGEIARSRWGEYKDKWYLYALRPKRLGGNVFWGKMLPLLQEQNRLKDRIRKAAYTDEQWRALSEDDRDAAFLELYGDRAVEKIKATKAASSLLDELKAVSLDNLEGKAPPDPTEDLTTFTEVDPGYDMTVTASKNAIYRMPRNVESYLYKDYGVGHFGDFDIDFEVTLTLYQNYTWQGIISVGDSIGSYDTLYDAEDSFVVYHIDYSNRFKIYVKDFTDMSGDYYDLYSSSKHYYSFARSGTTLTNSIYSDADRTTLVDTQTTTCPTDTYRYLQFGYSKGDTISYAGTSDLENLDLQEITEKGSSDSGTGSEVKASGNPVATLTKSETGSGADAKESGNPAVTLTVDESGSGVETKASDNPIAILAESEAGSGSDALSSLLAELLKDEIGSGYEALFSRDLALSETGSGFDVKADYPGGEIAASESGEGNDTAALMAVIVIPGDSGIGAEVSYLDKGFVTKVGSDTGVGTETRAATVSLISSAETGSGVEAVRDRALILAESGIGAEFSSPEVNWTAIDAGAGVEVSILIPVFFDGDAGLGSELSRMLKDIRGGDGGSGFDALKALVGTMGAGTDMRLHGRSGRAKMPSRRVRMPSKGVNI